MADEKKKEAKIILEREYNVPLRREWLKVPRHKRSKKAAKALREFLQKHMKSDDVKLGMHVNEHIWKHGIKNPPHHVKVKVQKYDDGVVKAELEGKEFKEAVKSKPKEEKPQGLKGKLQKVLGKDEKEEVVEKKTEEKKEVKKEKPVKTEKKKEAKKVTKKKSTKPSTKKTTSKSTVKKATKK